MKEYVNMKTGERVPEDAAQGYALDKLGIEIKPVGQFGVMTVDQYVFLDVFTEWYFSADWILENVQEEECELDDRCYV